MHEVLVRNNEVVSSEGKDLGITLYKRSVGIVSNDDTEKQQVLNLGIDVETSGEYIAHLCEGARREYGIKTNAEINQSEYAKILGVSRATIQTWEAGNNLPKVQLLAVLCWHFGISLEEVAVDLIRLSQPSLVSYIPKEYRDQHFSIPRFLDVLEGMPNDILFQVHRKFLDIMDKRFKRFVEKERNNDVINGNGEA